MKRLLFLFLVYTGTITTLTKTSAYALEDSCLVCGEQGNIFSLCAERRNHTLSCKKHCPALFDFKKCSECQGPLKTTDSLPKAFEDEINARVRNTKILRLEKQIEDERLGPIKNHHSALVDSILGTFGCKVGGADNRKVVQQTKSAMAKRAAQHQTWSLVVSIMSYYRAWQEMMRNPEDLEAHTKIDLILQGLPNYEDQEIVHLIGNNLERFQLVHNGLFSALNYTEGHKLDIPPDLKTIALQEMHIAETPL